jgi:hypothetical protein
MPRSGISEGTRYVGRDLPLPAEAGYMRGRKKRVLPISVFANEFVWIQAYAKLLKPLIILPE